MQALYAILGGDELFFGGEVEKIVVWGGVVGGVLVGKHIGISIGFFMLG